MTPENEVYSDLFRKTFIGVMNNSDCPIYTAIPVELTREERGVIYQLIHSLIERKHELIATTPRNQEDLVSLKHPQG